MRSAKGAEYDCHGQALSGTKRVAPGGKIENCVAALKERNKLLNNSDLFRTFSALLDLCLLSRGDAPRSAQRLAPGYHIPRLRRCARRFTTFRQSRLLDKQVRRVQVFADDTQFFVAGRFGGCELRGDVHVPTGVFFYLFH